MSRVKAQRSCGLRLLLRLMVEAASELDRRRRVGRAPTAAKQPEPARVPCKRGDVKLYAGRTIWLRSQPCPFQVLRTQSPGINERLPARPDGQAVLSAWIELCNPAGGAFLRHV